MIVNERGRKMNFNLRNYFLNVRHRYRCPKCPSSFPRTSALNKHLLSHIGKKQYKCLHCPQSFFTKTNRDCHTSEVHENNSSRENIEESLDLAKPNKCPLCGSYFNYASGLVNHYKKVHPTSEIPDYVYNKFNLEFQSSKNEYEFKNDEEDFIDIYQTLGYRNYCSNKRNNNDIIIFIADDKLMEETTTSMDISTTNNNCDNKNENIPIDIQTAMDQNDLDFIEKCMSDKYKNASRAEMEQMYNDSLEKFNKAKVPIKPCHVEMAGIQIGEISGKNSFTPVYHRPQLQKPQKKVFAKPKQYIRNVSLITTCWVCEAKFATRHELQVHLKSHNIDHPFKCYLCDASYLSREESIEHKMSHHPSDWELLVEKNNIGDLDVYISAIDIMVEKSLNCGKQICEGKGRKSNAKDYNLRKVYCTLCAKRFWAYAELRRHMKSHTGERIFSCDQCGKCFSMKHNMLIHRRNHHKIFD